MRPKSDPKTRLATIKDLRASPALRPHAMDDAKHHALLRREKAAVLLAERSKPSGYLGGVAHDGFSFAARYLIIADGWDAGSMSELAKGLAFAEVVALWHQRICTPKRSNEEYDADNTSTVLKQSIWATFVWAHQGDWAKARWMAEYLLSYFESGSVRVPSEETENDYRTLFASLLQALRDDAWPDVFPTTLGPYKELIETRHEPTRFAHALVATADLRMARSCGYAQVDDARGFGPYAPPLMMGDFAFVAMPAELWAIRALSERLDGLSLNLDADHPWLRVGFAQPPTDSLPTVQDPLLEAVRRRIAELA